MFPISDSVQRTRTPVLVWCLIAANIVAFVYQVTLTNQEAAAFLREYALVPKRYFNWQWAIGQGLSPSDMTPFLTSMFLHGSILHILFNMWTLFIFGPALEDRLGSGRFAVLYLLSGLGAGMLHLIFNWSSQIPTLGASGAIAGLIAAYALRFPFAWVNVLVPIIFIPLVFTIPAQFFAGLWFVMQILQGTTALFSPTQGGGIAWWAHIGGFATGWALLRLLGPGRHLYPTGRNHKRQRAPAQKPKP